MSRQSDRRSNPRLYLFLLPFVFGAVAINLFFLFLMLQAVGIAAISPATALIAAAPLSVPATHLATRWVRSLIAQAEKKPGRR
jgi:hypothetical protein